MIPHEMMNSSSAIQLFANFDSGNMLRYERVTSAIAASQISPNSTEVDLATNSNNNPPIESTVNTISHSLPKHDAEFNVWTKRDCEGTPKANGNRSWFYFGVRGGHGKCLRFNIMNLNRQARLFEMGMLPVFRTVPGHEKWSRLYVRPCWEVVNEDFKLSFVHRLADLKMSITYFAFCFPHSYEDMQILLDKYDSLYNSHLAHHYLERASLPANSADIYYHRETLCYSCDGNKVDLITITSYKGIMKEREHQFDRQLFPDASLITNRPHQFRHKRIYFLSSRVHPGETPAAFVFLGFLDFILKADDPRARLLRDLYIFKLIPILNPDGVQRGHYRTDQFGMNLNRVYLDPDLEKHPSIYAAKSLIAYHHVNNCTSQQVPLSVNDVFKDLLVPNEPSVLALPMNGVSLREDQGQETVTSSRKRFSPSSPFEVSVRHAFDALAVDEYAVMDNHQSFFLDRKENGLGSTMVTSMDLNDEVQHASPYAFHYLNNHTDVHRDSRTSDHDDQPRADQMRGNEGSDDEDDALSACQNNTDNDAREARSPHLANPDFLKISPYESGVAYYVDLHGHASKKGCFIYGNYLPDDEQHTDNVLFPKLISLNSPHFDFDNCNFTIKNMYMKDKREGLSKEGSGRVALSKHFGLLHSYTLECSYAMGKSCNGIPAAESESHGGRVSPATAFSLPPKFTIEHYRDVGKACALAAIDILPGRNPFSRVSQSTFRTLHSLRDFLKHQIRQQRNRTGNSRTISSTVPAANNRVKQPPYGSRLSQNYRTITNANLLAQQQLAHQASSSFPTASSAPPSTSTRMARLAATNAPSRIVPSSTNPQNSSRLRSTLDHRRYSTVVAAASNKRTTSSSINPAVRLATDSSRSDVGPHLEQPASFPVQLQRPKQQSFVSLQFAMPTGSSPDPLVAARNRPLPLPATTARNTPHRNALSLNTVPMNNRQASTMRGRSQNSANRVPFSTRTERTRQPSLVSSELRQPNTSHTAATVTYRHQLATDRTPVVFE